MNEVTTAVIGIDVSGERKGLHAVDLQNGTLGAMLVHSDPAVIVSWCLQLKAVMAAVDAPCGWSDGGVSRLAERSLAIGGNKLRALPRPHALAQPETTSTNGYSMARGSTSSWRSITRYSMARGAALRHALRPSRTPWRVRWRAGWWRHGRSARRAAVRCGSAATM